MKIIVGIDASRNRSGGAIDHMIGLLSEGNPMSHGIREVHVWSYKKLIDKLPYAPWLVKHNPPLLEKSLFHQVWWQSLCLTNELNKHGCDLLFASDAGTVARYKPMVVFSQDALSYEPGIAKYFGFSLARMRLILLYHIQNNSMRRANGVIFLTNYAATLIQSHTGRLNKTVTIPHGVDEKFRRLNSQLIWPNVAGQPIVCIYVSNVTMYKNQWIVVRAIKKLRDKGFNLKLLLVGRSSGPAKRLLQNEIKLSDPDGTFVKLIGHVNHDDLPSLLASANIFVFASSCETISITLLEAIATGLPIASSDRGPMPEVLQGGGVYFDPASEESIATAIERLINDEDLRASVVKQTETLSKKYSWARCASETWEFLRSIAEIERR